MRISDWSSDVCSSDLAAPELPPMAEGQSLTADYRSLGLSLGRHPMALLRARLAAMRFSSSAELRGQPDRRLVRTCGIVTVRQRPGTAKGMVFVTIEDEARSEEHTSELQSLMRISYAVFCLKKKKK